MPTLQVMMHHHLKKYKPCTQWRLQTNTSRRNEELKKKCLRENEPHKKLLATAGRREDVYN